MNPIQAVLRGKNIEKAEMVDRMLSDPGEVAMFEGELTREFILALGGGAGLFILAITMRVLSSYTVIHLSMITLFVCLVLLKLVMGLQLWYRWQAKTEYRRRKDDKPYKHNGLHG